MQVELFPITLQSLFFAFLLLGLTITLRGCDISLKQEQDVLHDSREQSPEVYHKCVGIDSASQSNRLQDENHQQFLQEIV